MTKEEFERELDVIHNKGRITELIHNKEISIDWETDKSKINLSVLRTFEGRKNVPLVQCVETHKLDAMLFHQNPLFHDGCSDGAQIIELVELIKNGVKIIPPTFLREVTTKNGVEQSVSMPLFYDGRHRIRIAYALGLVEIPISIIINYHHFYSVSSNCIKATDDGLIITSESYNHFYSFKDFFIDVEDDGIRIKPNC